MQRQYFYQIKVRDALGERIQKNPRYSLRAFAQRLGMHAGSFSQLLSGKRFPSERAARKICEALDLSPEDQAEFIQSLAKAKADAGLKRISPELRQILNSRESTSHRSRELSIDQFKIIADWYHAAILELPFTKGFQCDSKWIANALGISAPEVQAALQRLIALGLVELESGVLKRHHSQVMSGDRHLTNSALRRRQQQVLEKSIQSLQNDPIEARSHSAMTMAISSKKIPEAKRLIEKFIQEMTEFLEDGERDQVYELLVNLFPLQKVSTSYEPKEA